MNVKKTKSSKKIVLKITMSMTRTPTSLKAMAISWEFLYWDKIQLFNFCREDIVDRGEGRIEGVKGCECHELAFFTPFFSYFPNAYNPYPLELLSYHTRFQPFHLLTLFTDNQKCVY